MAKKLKMVSLNFQKRDTNFMIILYRYQIAIISAQIIDIAHIMDAKIRKNLYRPSSCI